MIPTNYLGNTAMIITPFIRNTAAAIRENSATDMFASAISKHSPVHFTVVADLIKHDGDLKNVDGFKSSLAVVGLFIAHKNNFLNALDEIANAHDQFAGGYLVELTGGQKDSVIHSLAMLKDYQLFEEAPSCAQQACYEIIHAIVIHIATHVIADYNLQSDLLARRVAAYEESIEA